MVATSGALHHARLLATKKTSAQAIADLSPGELEKRVEKIIQHLDAIDTLMADAGDLSDEERRSALRLGGEDDVKALSGVLAFADARPELFKVLATDDDGSDPAVFETKLLATRLKNADTLSKLVARFAETRCADLRQRALRRNAREKTGPARLRARQAVPDAPGEKG